MDYQDLILTTLAFSLKRSDGKRTAQFELHAPFVLAQPKVQIVDWDTLTELRKAATAADARWEDALVFGKLLADLLLPDEVRQVMLDRLTQAQAQRKGLRLRLGLSGDLQRLPWEFMAVNRAGGEMTPQDFLAIDPHLSIVRQPASTLPVWDIETNPLDKIRALVALASPDDQPPLDVERERTQLEKLFSGQSRVEARFVPHASPASLLDGTESIHLFHFAGHGIFTPVPISTQPGKMEGHGELLLESEAGYTARMDASELGIMLRSRHVRVALLGACHSAERDDLNQWSGIAEALLRAGLGAVVGMQFAVKDTSAIAFAEKFYATLLAGMTIDEAVNAGRVTLASVQQDVRGLGTPVLYLRDTNGVVFPEMAALPAQDAEQRGIAQTSQREYEKTRGIAIGKIDLRRSQGAILNNTGAVTQHFGNIINTGGGKYVKEDRSTRIDTGGGTYIAGSVHVGGDFVGRDKVTNNTTTGSSGATSGRSSAQEAQMKKLHDVLSNWFGAGDLQELAFRMSIDWEDLIGETKGAKSRSLVQHCQRFSRLDELYQLVKQARPKLDL